MGFSTQLVLKNDAGLILRRFLVLKMCDTIQIWGCRWTLFEIHSVPK